MAVLRPILAGARIRLQARQGFANFMIRAAYFSLVLAAAVGATPADAQEVQPAEQGASVTLTAQQVFTLADEARAKGDYQRAEALFRALTQDRDLALRNEARFRLAMMLADQLDRKREAAVLLRQILDEQPDVARVRLELARMQAQMGNLAEAERELRAAQAAGLPPEVERLVRFFTRSLANAKPFGIELEVAIAPDTNINRATGADTLDTIIGEFELDDDAQAQSGIGLATRGSAYVKFRMEDDTELFLRANGSGRFYRENQFEDASVGFQIGPRYKLGKDRLDVTLLALRRWFGGEHYTDSYGATGAWRRPLDDQTQLRIDAGLIYNDDQLNDLRDAERASLAVSLDHALKPTRGVGLRIDGARSFAEDPGYATATAGVTAYGYEEIGSVTAVARLGYQRIEADERLFLYPERRVDNRLEASLSATLRSLQFATFAPQMKVTYERSFSTVGIYDYSRLATEVGLVAAF